MKTSIVIGSQFGDEGKGSTVAWVSDEAIAKRETPIVVRFSGGPQAGHHVLYKDKSHTFHHFGSASLRGVATFWSKYCYTEPGAICHEYDSLIKLGLKPILYIDPMSPVITPYDRLINQLDPYNKKHGTCGQGIGAAAKRNEETPYKLYAKELFAAKDILRTRLDSLSSYYVKMWGDWQDHHWKQISKEVEAFYIYAEAIQNIASLQVESDLNDVCGHLVFEGSQGILLDRDHGFFPHVTRAHTTSKNAKEMIERNGWDTPEVYYVTRPYLTRHGNGPMGPVVPVELKNTEGEINVTNPWQGEFRTSIFNRQLFDYAISCDPYNYLDYKVVITGMDRVDATMTYRNKLGEVVTTDKYLFARGLGDFISEEYKFMRL